MQTVTDSDLDAVFLQLADDTGLVSPDALTAAFAETGTRIQSRKPGRDEIEELMRCTVGRDNVEGLDKEAFFECAKLFPVLRRVAGKLLQQQFSPMTRRRRTRRSDGVLVPTIREEAEESPALAEKAAFSIPQSASVGSDIRAALEAQEPADEPSQAETLQAQAHAMASPQYSPLLMTSAELRERGLDVSAREKQRRQHNELARQVAERNAHRAQLEAEAHRGEAQDSARLSREQAELRRQYADEASRERALSSSAGIGAQPAAAQGKEGGEASQATQEGAGEEGEESRGAEPTGAEEGLPPPKLCGCALL